MDEFGFLKDLKQHFNFDLIGDDCAVLPFSEEFDLLATADLLIEGTDFDLGWAGPADIGHKSLAVSLSDIAAMGGDPLWALFSIGVPDRLANSDFLTDLFSGINDLADKYGVRIAGGDVSGGTDRLTIDSIVLGRSPSGQAVRRRGAGPGELICVSGQLGGAAAGLLLLQSQSPGATFPANTLRQLRPVPKITLGKHLQTHGLASSMIDISDGLSSDLGHICDASEVGAVIEAEALPLDPLLGEVPEVLAFQRRSPIDLALHGGEDFELLFTTVPENEAAVTEAGCTVIGRIVADPAAYSIVLDGRETPLPRGGYRHFRD